MPKYLYLFKEPLYLPPTEVVRWPASRADIQQLWPGLAWPQDPLDVATSVVTTVLRTEELIEHNGVTTVVLPAGMHPLAMLALKEAFERRGLTVGWEMPDPADIVTPDRVGDELARIKRVFDLP